MSRHDATRLADIEGAIGAIERHLSRGDLDDSLVYDAIRARLMEIGEAVKAITPELLNSRPEIPWPAIARMRDHLVHRYFETDRSIVEDVVRNELRPLLAAVQFLAQELADSDRYPE